MKVKIGVAAVIIALAALQYIFGGKKDAPAPVADAPAAAPASAPATSAPGLPAPGAVTGIEIDGTAVTLDKTENGWTVRQLGGAPAPREKVEAFLNSLLAGELSSVPSADTEDGGTRVVLTTPAEAAAFVIGLHPEGDFDSTYVEMPNGERALVAGDLRAELGLWKNRTDETPDALAWLDTRALRFDPAQAASLTATYPDHAIVLSAPGDEGLRAWLADLADFRITGIADLPDAEESLTHSIVLAFADGTEKTVRVAPSHAGGDAVAVFSDFPGKAFVLPNWRFEKYFNRLPSLFPDAAPHFALEDVRVLDIRRANESVKITRRDGGWEPVALPYAAKADRTEQLARFLSAWRPEDYADADAKTRPAYGGPMVEVVLADGAVHQYRLSGRHPVFPWRYVTLDGARVFSVTDAEAEVMFPGFADVLELGTVFPAREDDSVVAYGVEDIRVVRGDDGEWSAEVGEQSMPLAAVEAEALAAELRGWRVAGFYHPERGGDGEADHRVTLVPADGEENGITLFPPVGRDIPYRIDGGEYFLLERVKFQNWLASLRDIGRRAEEYAAPVAEPEPAPVPVEEPAPEPVPVPAPVEEPAPAPEPAPVVEEPAPEPVPAPEPAPAARKIVPAEVDYSGPVSGKIG